MPSEANPRPPQNSSDARDRLIEVLKLDRVEPGSGDAVELEQLPNYRGGRRPLNWYLTGFLVPPGTRAWAGAEFEAADDLDDAPD